MGFLRWWDAIFMAVAVCYSRMQSSGVGIGRVLSGPRRDFGDLISTDIRWLAWVLAAWPPSTSRHSHTCPC